MSLFSNEQQQQQVDQSMALAQLCRAQSDASQREKFRAMSNNALGVVATHGAIVGTSGENNHTSADIYLIEAIKKRGAAPQAPPM